MKRVFIFNAVVLGMLGNPVVADDMKVKGDSNAETSQVMETVGPTLSEYMKLSVADKVQVLHSEILNLLIKVMTNSDLGVTRANIDGITIEDCQRELETRKNHPEIKHPADAHKADVRQLSQEILSAIVHSPGNVTVAGIAPRAAAEEQLTRWNIIPRDATESITNEKIMQYYEWTFKNNIDKWDENERAEAVQKFLEEASDSDPMALEIQAIRNRDKQSDVKSKLEEVAKEATAPIYYDQEVQNESNAQNMEEPRAGSERSEAQPAGEKSVVRRLLDAVSSWF